MYGEVTGIWRRVCQASEHHVSHSTTLHVMEQYLPLLLLLLLDVCVGRTVAEDSRANVFFIVACHLIIIIVGVV